ncbi:MAG: hypothetical protein EU547_00020 [Promethearchaeota archaeon]|nr:MAG: hypothetical protein EU547_00020 [Candidatus Lokiarchaeota archaeon]
MEIYLFFINFIGISIILSLFTFFDIKFRIISKKILKISIILSFLSNFFEICWNSNNLFSYIITKLSVVFIITLFSFLLFSLNLIGGGDGKIAIISFTFIPFQYILIFSSLFLIFFTIFLINIANLYQLYKKDLFYSDIFIKKENPVILILNKENNKSSYIFPFTLPYTFAYLISFILSII